MSDGDPAGPAPRVFISYTHENPAHKAWVATLASNLRENGIDAVLDQWELTYGADVTLFMEGGIRSATRVLLVCTPAYARKANEGTGGVGYERLVVTGEMAKNIDTNKFICVLRAGDDAESLPTFAKTRLYVDFRDDTTYAVALEELLRDLHKAPANPKPPLGPSPFAGASSPPNFTSAPASVDLASSKDPESVFAKAEQLLRQRDLMGWKRLVRNTRKDVVPILQAWRDHHDGKIEDEKALGVALQGAVTACSPLFVLALSAVDSEIESIRDQRGLIDDLLNIPAWNGSGQTVVVEVPSAMGLIYHYMLGAHLVASGRQAEAIDLLTAQVTDPVQRKTVTLWQSHNLMGWTKSLQGDCSVSWAFLKNLYKSQNWLAHFFISEMSFITALRAYALLGSALELSQFVREGKGTLEKLTGSAVLNVPPMFAISDHGGPKLAQVITLAIPRQTITELIARAGKVAPDDLRSAWPRWIDRWAAWHHHTGRHAYGVEIAEGDRMLP